MERIAVIGSRSLLRSGLVSLLATIGFNTIEEADDFQNLRERMNGVPPSKMIILWLAQGIEHVVSDMNEIKSWGTSASIVLVVPKFDLDVMSGCFAAGACGYLLESISRDALRESIQLVSAGEKVFPSELASLFPMLISKLSQHKSNGLEPLESELSSREIEILQCLMNGQSNKVIAKNLEIAEATVKVHVKRILRKAHVVNRTQAALWAVATGITSAPAQKLQPAGSADPSRA